MSLFCCLSSLSPDCFPPSHRSSGQRGRENKKQKEGRKPRPVGAKGAPSKKDFEDAAKTAKKKDGGLMMLKNGGIFVQSKGS